MVVNVKKLEFFESAAQAFVCPVNTIGAINGGIDKALKHKYPGLDEAYKRACKEQLFARKGFLVWPSADGRLIVCLPTRVDWREPSDMSLIERGLQHLAQQYPAYGLESLAMPMIGFEPGESNWTRVLPVVEKWLDPLPDLHVDIYASA